MGGDGGSNPPPHLSIVLSGLLKKGTYLKQMKIMKKQVHSFQHLQKIRGAFFSNPPYNSEKYIPLQLTVKKVHLKKNFQLSIASTRFARSTQI